MAMKYLTTILWLIAGVTAGALGLASPGAGSPIFKRPARTVQSVHSKCPEVKKSCTTCHPAAKTSQWASHRLVPPMQVCARCHDGAEGANVLSEKTAACRTCHRATPADAMPTRSVYPRPNMRFSHHAHRNTDCKVCHKKTGSAQDPTGDLDVIGMEECYRCHQNSSCRTCHLTNQKGTMITDIDGKKLLPPRWLFGPTHGSEWSGTHAADAGRSSRKCASCHEEKFCQSCHSGARRPRNIHPGDWLTAHGLGTRLDNPRCRGCHRKQTFCITCHRRSGVAPDSPPDSKPKDGSGRFHRGMDTPQLMRRAKHDVLSCISCHTESSCVACHARINPHPRDFKRRCRTLTMRNRQSCSKCHSNDVSRFCK